MNTNFFSETLTKFKLTVRLMKDNRVSLWLKLIPAFCLFYLIVPVDILVGPIDDAIVIYVGMDLFIDFCPRDVVEEHLQELRTAPMPKENEEVIEAEFKE